MTLDIVKLKGLYGRLKGIRDVIAISPNYLSEDLGHDFDKIVKEVSSITSEDCSHFLLSPNNWYQMNDRGIKYTSSNIREKLFQFMGYLENTYNLPGQIIQIGTIYNSINDEELKSRCADILSSNENFDRVINQATLVLEDRIRKKSQINDQVGIQLLSKAFSKDLDKSILLISENVEEQDGIIQILRGIILSFRNPTHHKIIEKYSRADALKFCAFIDVLLALIDRSKINPIN